MTKPLEMPPLGGYLVGETSEGRKVQIAPYREVGGTEIVCQHLRFPDKSMPWAGAISGGLGHQANALSFSLRLWIRLSSGSMLPLQTQS